MNGASPSQEKSRWGLNSIHVGSLHGAPSDDQFELHLAAIEYELSTPITIETKEDILSRKHWSERLEPFEHQVQNLITFCRRSPVALFADDVGLGKTISAGLVLNELQTRKKVRRALILCPKMLLHQWKDELAEKFGIHAAHGVGNELNPWLHHAVPVVITTFESARDRMDSIRTASFDMLILDEAHKLRNLHGTAKTPEVAKAIHGSLANRDFKYVLMLTATPIQNRLWDMYSLIDCLSTAKGHANPLGSPGEFVQRYVADSSTTARKLRQGTRDDFRRRVQDYMVRTSRQDANLAFPVRHVKPVQCQASAAEKALQQLVGTAIEKLNALARMSLAEALMSSPRALLAQVRRMNGTGTLNSSILQLFEKGVQAAGTGCKLAKLHEILAALHEKNPGKWRAIVFTRRLDTLDLICEGLQAKGIRAATIRGSGEATNQKSIKAFKSDPPQVNVLVSTDAGAVGLNLQVCNIIINYDLPWNPMVLEQRIGRVQRLGSSFQHIEVLNLTVKDSVEDHIVARLLSKLQLISTTIGDIEAILEASHFDDDERFEEELRTLVTRALMGQDVEAALRQAQESIRKAKEIYDAERAQVEETLGGMDEMHRSGPTVPKLKPRPPRFDVPTFCRKAFACEGATLHELPNQQIRVAPRGRGAWTATFDDKDPDLLRAGLGTFGGASIQLYEEGSRAFEGLLGEWRKRHSHRVLDRVEESRKSIRPALHNWVNSFGLDLIVKEWGIREEHLKFNGHLDIRATASISHDRFEKMCGADHCCHEHGSLPNPSPKCEPLRECGISEMLPEARKLLAQAVETDSDIREFIRFYDARLEEEVERAGRTSAQRSEVSRRYETSLAAELVGATGSRYITIEVDAVFTDASGKTSFKAPLHIVPLTGKVLSEPERYRCDSTKKGVPQSWLGDCAVSNQKVLLHLLETSVLSGTTALSKFFGTCGVSGRRLLNKELGKSDVSGKTVGMDLLRKSEVSGRRALENELMKCEITGATALPDELERSGISGRMVRTDRVIASPKSGTRGHRSEFRTCEETHALILQEEGATSDLSGRFVCKELLVTSEKNPNRHGLQAEMVQCSVTSKRLLTDEAEKSAVSGNWVDKDEAIYSGVSSRPARRDEVLTCAISGLTLLPDEAGKSDVSGRTVDARLLERSEISKKVALKEELRVCAFTVKQILSTEGTESEVSGKFVRLDEVTASAISKLRGHTSEFVRCDVSKDWLLPGEVDKSDLSGMQVRLDILRSSDKAPGRKGVDTEFETCEVTGRVLLRDEVARSEASGRLVDRDILATSPVSGRHATEDEMITCEESGIRVLPDEVDVCAITGKRIDLRRLVKSGVSGRTALRSKSANCEITGVVALVDELERSKVSGLLCRIDQMEASELSGLHAHRSEMVTCELSGQRLLPSEVARSVVSNRIARTDLLISSQKKSDRLGFPDETVICASTGKRLLRDEVGISDASGRIVDRDLLVASSVRGRLATEDELISCDETGIRLLSDETAVCAITGKRVDRRRLVKSEISERFGIAAKSDTCQFTGRTVLVDEIEVSQVSGKRCGTDLMESSDLSGQRAHGSEMEACVLSGQRLLPSEIEHSSLSNRVARRDLLSASQKDPNRLGLPEEFCVCASSAKRLLLDEVVKSDFSGRFVDRDLAMSSGVSRRIGLPEEMISCEETGTKLLPDETDVCFITGKRVNRSLVGTSDLSGTRGLIRLLQICPETRKTGFTSELVCCAVSGLRVAPSEAATCAVTGEIVLTRLMVECATSGHRLRRDKAQTSEKTGRLGHPDKIRICNWTGLRLLADETRQCGITGLDFDSDLVPEASPAQAIVNLLQSGAPDSLPPDPHTEGLRFALAKAGIKVRGLNQECSTHGNTVAYFVDCSGLFGLRKRHAVGFATNDQEYRLLHAPCCGQLHDNSWVPEVAKGK